MPRKPTSKKSNQLDTMFPPIGEEVSLDNGDGGTAGQPDFAAQIAELKGAVTTLMDSVKAGASREEKMQQLIMGLAAQRPTATEPQAPAAQPMQGIDLSKLPDPTKDAEGFRRGLQDQVAAMVQNNVAANVAPMRRQQEQAAKLQNLWTKFRTKHADLAEYEDLAESIATRMVQTAVRSGADAEKFIFGVDDGDTFVESVATGLKDRLTKIRGGEQGQDGDDSGEADDDASGDTVTDQHGRAIPRTLGLDNGTNQPAGQRHNDNTNQRSTTLIDELKDAQSRARIY